MILYTSDTHLSHDLVRKSRPYDDAASHDAACVAALRDALLDPRVTHLYHAGDVSMNFPLWVEENGPLFHTPVGKTIVCGNHDQVVDGDKSRYRKRLAAFLGSFEEVIGHVTSWEGHGIAIEDVLDGEAVSVLVSHAPIEHMWGCDVNVHGHIHAGLLLPAAHRPGYEWTGDSATHFNAGADLHRLRPKTLQELADAHRARYPEARGWLIGL